VWMLAPIAYNLGVAVGLALAAAAGVALAILVARSARDDGQGVLLAAAASLLIMPYLLPKMQDRYFYGFELTAIVLACLNPRYLVVALIAQVDGVLSYLPYELTVPPGAVAPAILCNGALAVFILFEWLKPKAGGRFAWVHYAAYAAAERRIIFTMATEILAGAIALGKHQTLDDIALVNERIEKAKRCKIAA